MGRLESILADITTLDVDAIVNAANQQLKGGGGVDGAIHRAAGTHDLLKATAKFGGCATGDAVPTPGFRLPARWIFHTVGPVWSVTRGGSAAEERADALLASCYCRCMELAREYKVRSIAFPAISTGIYRFPPDRAAQIAVNTVRQSLEESGVQRVIFCAYNMETEAIYRELLQVEDLRS